MTVMWEHLLEELENLFPHGFVSIALYDNNLKVLRKPTIESSSVILSPLPEPLAKVDIENGITIDFRDLNQEEAQEVANQITAMKRPAKALSCYKEAYLYAYSSSGMDLSRSGAREHAENRCLN